MKVLLGSLANKLFLYEMEIADYLGSYAPQRTVLKYSSEIKVVRCSFVLYFPFSTPKMPSLKNPKNSMIKSWTTFSPSQKVKYVSSRPVPNCS